MLDAMTGTLTSGGHEGMMRHDGLRGNVFEQEVQNPMPSNSGGASRFFFRADYDEGDVPVDTDHHGQINQGSTP